MNFHTLATCAAMLSLPFGAGFLLLPVPSAALYGASLADPGTQLLGRYFGSEILMYAAAAWSLRALRDAGAQRRGAAWIAAATAAGLAVTLLGLRDGTLTALCWSSVALYGAFAAGWLRLALRPALPRVADVR